MTYKNLAEHPAQQEPVRIYDYVWPQRDEHKEECVYACSYTPGHHLARGELLAVVHPSQLKNAYLQRDGEAAPQPTQRKPLTPEWIWTWLMDWCKRNGTSPANYDSLFKMVSDARAIEAKLKEKNT